MKKLFTLLLALVATTALWAEDFSVDGIYYKILTDKTNEVEVCSGYPKYTGSVTIPSSVTYNGTTYSVTSIGDWAFYGCSSLTSITIPNSVTSIGEEAFYGCSRLRSIVWNAKNCADESSSSSAPFDDIRSQITSFTFGDSVQHIPAYMCYGMSNLTSITIPNSVTSIGCNAFYNTGIYNNESNWKNGVLYISNCLIEAKDDISGAYIIKEGTRLIGNYAFYNCSSLTSITIPNSVTSIGDNAFRGCTGLTSITIPNSVTSIGNYAFYGCSSLTSITIPNSVTSIGSGAFYGCSSLTSITIPNSVTSIGSAAFFNCSSLTSIIIPNSVTKIGGGVFYGCKKLVSIVLPENITSLHHYVYYSDISVEIVYSAGFFDACSSLTSVTIPNSVTSIGDRAFYGCSSLTSITIPNSVTSIGDRAFYGCSSLTSITCEASTPPVLSGAFSGISNTIPVYVPCGSEDTYKSADGWNLFSDIQEPLADYTINVFAQDTQKGRLQ